MSRTLEGPRQVGPLTVAAIVWTECSVQGSGHRIYGTGMRRPLAIAFHDGAQLSGWRPDGTRLEPDALEQLWPGIEDALRQEDGG